MSPSRSAKAAESPDSPSSSPFLAPPDPETRASSLFAPIPSSPPSNSETSDSPSLPPQETGTWSSVDSPPEPLAPAESSDTPSTGKGLKLSKAGLRTGIGAGFKQACKLAASFLATELERVNEVWVPDVEDVQDVAAPAANMIYRRLPDDAKHGDLIDLMVLGAALVGYVGKVAARRRELRAVLAQQEPQDVRVGPNGENGPLPTFPGGGF
jgi:hypothetical protein